VPAAKWFPPNRFSLAGRIAPSFAENFLRRLRQEEYQVVRVNAWEARQQRNNLTASCDSVRWE
jgi:hypothetical protein